LLQGTFANRSYVPKVANAGVTTIACVTQTLEQLRALRLEPAALPALRRLTHSGSRLEPELFDWMFDLFGRHGVDIYLMYGQTEACGRISVLQPAGLPHLHRSVGRAMSSGSLAISDSGEILYRGPGVMLGYAHDRQELSLGDTLHGLLRTGDLGRLDAAGNLYITGRCSRYCKVFGRRICLDDIDAFVRTERLAATVEKDGVIAVFFEGRHSVDRSWVMRMARHFQLPPQTFRLLTLECLPRTSRGKIRYGVLQQCCADIP
jgi:acyl-CoA synthetase (AMP-forming)/AMP-acid ligase II